MKEIINNLQLKYMVYGFISSTLISMIGFFLYPNFIFQLGLTGIYFLSVLLIPCLIIWFWNQRATQKGFHKVWSLLISLVIGIIVSIIPHMICAKSGNEYLQKATLKSELYIDKFKELNEVYPENMTVLIDSLAMGENIITRRYMDLITINHVDSTNYDQFPFNKYRYRLTSGFWMADLKIWNPDLKEWILVF